jgi:hypothetical protein
MFSIGKFLTLGCLLAGLAGAEAPAPERQMSATVQSLSDRAYHQAEVVLAHDRLMLRLPTGKRLVLQIDTAEIGDEEIVGRDENGKYWAVYVEWKFAPKAPVVRRPYPVPTGTRIGTT